MLNRMATALFKPRILAKYLADKMYYPIMFLVLMLLISIAPFSLALKNGYAILPNEYDLIKEAISSTAGEVKIEAGKMSKSNDYMLKTQYFIYTFDSPNLSLMSTVVNITASEIEVYEYGIRINTKPHNLDNLCLNQDASAEDIFEFSYLVYNFIKETEPRVKVMFAIYTIIDELIYVVALLLIFYIVGAFINPIVRKKFRLYLIIYSLCAFYLFNALSRLVDIEVLSYVGLAYSFVVYYKALKAIVKIEVRKG